MTAGCMAWGVLLGWLRLRTGSVWPAVFGHGVLNAAGGMVVMLAQAGVPLELALQVRLASPTASPQLL